MLDAKKIILFALMCIALPTHTAWQDELDHIDFKQMAREVGYDTAVFTSITGTLIAAILQVTPLLAKSIPATKYPKAYKFICEELEKDGIDPQTVTIKGVMPYSWATTSTLFGIYLFCPENDLIEIENMLTEHPDTTLLDRYKFVINHEANHIRHKHIRGRITTVMATIIGTFAITRTCRYLAENNPEVLGLTSDDSSLGKVSKVLTVLNLCSYIASLSSLPLLAHCRTQEQEADDTTRNDRALLNGGIKYFGEIEKITDHSPIIVFLNTTFGNFFSTHPSLPHRIEMLKGRLALLDASNR